MNARIRKSGRLARWVVLFAGLFGTAEAVASPLTYSTSGTVAVSNEPDQQLHGVSGVDPTNARRVDPMFPIDLGSIAITPVRIFPAAGGGVNGQIPALTGAPFDITIKFSRDDLPSLEIRGVIGTNGGIPTGENFTGNVTSLVSSAPSLDASLPPPFAAMVANPAGVRVAIGMWDWDITRLQVSASVQTVPEPTTAGAFLAMLVGLGLRTRRKSRI